MHARDGCAPLLDSIVISATHRFKEKQVEDFTPTIPENNRHPGRFRCRGGSHRSLRAPTRCAGNHRTGRAHRGIRSAEPTTAPAAATGGTVKWAEFYSLLTDANGKLNQDWIAGVIKQFEDENPGWKVEQEGIKWDQIDQKSILDLRAGVDHDLMFSSPQLMAKHAKTGDYIDLTPVPATPCRRKSWPT